MRIGIDARFYGSVGKGLGRYTEKLIGELERVDSKNEYIIFLSPENFSEYVPKNPRFQKVLTTSRWYGWAEQLFFPLLLFRYRLDLMHFPHFNVPLLYRRPLVFTLHDLILFHYPTRKSSTRGAAGYWLKFWAYRLVLASALKRARAVITVSDFTAQDIAGNYPEAEKKIRVTKEATEQWCHVMDGAGQKDLFRQLGLIADGSSQENIRDIIAPYVLYVGNAYPHKNLEVLLEAACALPEKRFVFVGKEDFFYRRLKQRANSLHVANVIFADYLTDRELGALYRHAESYVFPSLYEGFGLPPLEAMQYGIPVLAARTSSLPEVLGEAALYFHPTDPGALVSLLRRLDALPALREELRQKGYVQAARTTWAQMALETQALYEEIANTHTKAPKWTFLTNQPKR